MHARSSAERRCAESKAQGAKRKADAEVLTDDAVVNVSLLVREGNIHSFRELVDICAIGFNHAEQAGCALA